MRILVCEIGIMLLLCVTLISGGGVGFILAEFAAIYWLNNFRKRTERGGESY